MKPAAWWGEPLKKLDSWDALAVVSTLILGAGVWFVYFPAALMFVGAIGLAFAVLAAGGKR
jgi:hypothetical protein